MHHTSSSSIYHHQNNIYIKNIHFISPLSSQVKQSNYKKQYTQYNERIQNKRYLKNEKKMKKMIFISSAALSKIRCAAGTCHSVLTKRYAFIMQRWPWTVSTDAVQLVNRSKSPDRKQQSSWDQWLWLSVAHRVCQRQPSYLLKVYIK